MAIFVPFKKENCFFCQFFIDIPETVAQNRMRQTLG
jgi:hypothetical protein